MHLSSINPHIQAIFNIQATKYRRSPCWHLPRQPSGALAPPVLLTGVSSFAFQGTNAHAVVKQAKLSSTVTLAVVNAFVHQRVWVAPPFNATLQAATGLGVTKRCQQISYETFLAAPRLAFMWQHIVEGMPLVPAAAFVEIASASASSLFNRTDMQNMELASLQFATPCILRGDGRAKVTYYLHANGVDCFNHQPKV